MHRLVGMFPVNVITLTRLLNNSLRCFSLKSRYPAVEWKPFDETDVKNHVANLFQCKQSEADKLVNSIKEAFERDHSGRIEILRALRKKGLTIKNALHCKPALKQNHEAVNERIKFTSEVLQDDSPSTIISILRLSDKDYEAVHALLSKENEKVTQLAELLKISRLETSLLFIKYPFLIRSRTSTLQAKLDALIENNMSVEDVRKDLWVLTYTLKRLQSRLEEIKGMDIHPIKPWMLRCLPEIIHRTFQYRHDNQEALGSHPNVTSYLSSRLGVTEREIVEFAKKHPPVMRVHVAKMKEIIDYLMAEGYSTHNIVRTPRILCHSVTTIQERLSSLKQRNYYPKVLSVLCKSVRSFDDFLKRVDHARKNEKMSQLKS